MVSGLHPATERPIKTRFRCAFPIKVKLATECKSLTHYTKGTRSPSLNGPHLVAAIEDRFHSFLLSFVIVASDDHKDPKAVKAGLPLFVCMRFQDLFHSPPGVLFAFPSRY